MKLVSLLLLSALGLALSGCNTLVTRRDLWSPSKGGGPWTKEYKKQRDSEGLLGISNPYPRRGKGPNPEEGIFGISHPPR